MFISFNGFAQEENSTFVNGCSAYQKGDFQAALNQFLELENNYEDWKLFYNIGNCYYKLEDYFNAKLYYLKALKLSPNEEEIINNIRVVNYKFLDKVEEQEVGFLNKVLNGLKGFIPMNILSIMLIFFSIILNILIIYLIVKKRNKFLYYLTSFFLFIFILLFAWHLLRVNDWEKRDIALLKNDNTYLYSGPGSNNTVLFTLNRGYKINILSRKGDWFEVSSSDKIAGWVKLEDMQII